MSHYVIGIITYAEEPTTAFTMALNVAKDLCDRGDFIGHTPLHEKLVNIDEFKGIKLDQGNPIEGAAHAMMVARFNYYQSEFQHYLDMMRKEMLNKTDFELWMDDGMWRHYAMCLGERRGYHVKLYDGDGEGIVCPDGLINRLNKWKCQYEDKGKNNPNKDKNIYISFIGMND